jgi:hypothetical protein
LAFLRFVLAWESVCGQNSSNLFHLVRLGFAAARLKIQNLSNPVSCKYMVIPANSLRKSEMRQQRAQVIEPDIRIRSAS